jgi:hypothetical protein
MSDYDTDFYTWTPQQAQALRAKDFAALDLAHLAEEIDDLGSHLERLLFHLLKLAYDPATCPRRGWKVTVDHARQEIAKYLRRNPSLRHLPAGYLAEAYRIARRGAALAMDRPPADFPEGCPWALAQVLDENWWPEERQ